MITIVIPTRNRAYTLKRVLETYYQQKHVDQMVIVNDGSSDDTEDAIKTIASQYPYIETVLASNKTPMGASYSRNRGVLEAKNPYILFGEDDAFLEKNYTEALLPKLQKRRVGIASGRLISLFPKENPNCALKRFGNGNPKHKKTFSIAAFSHLPDAYYRQDIFLPLTHALILTKKELLQKYPYDTYYATGNAFREESDFQVNAFLNGENIIVTNDTHCMHLHPRDARVGGHHIPIFKSAWYKIYYTHYFFKKYYRQLRKKMQLPYPRWIAIIIYVLTQINELMIAAGHYIKKKCF